MLGVTFLIIVGIRSVSMSIQIDGFQICIYTDIIEINVARKIKHSFEIRNHGFEIRNRRILPYT